MPQSYALQKLDQACDRLIGHGELRSRIAGAACHLIDLKISKSSLTASQLDSYESILERCSRLPDEDDFDPEDLFQISRDIFDLNMSLHIT